MDPFETLASMFDRSTVMGFFAWLTLQLHLVRIGRRQTALERVQKALVHGHVDGVQAHRDLAVTLPAAQR